MLVAEFDEKCRRLGNVRDAMVRSLAAKHATSLQKQGVAMKGLQRDLQRLHGDLETVKVGLSEQLSIVDEGGKPHWKFMPLQRVATTTEREAAVALQRKWRARKHIAGWQYSTPAERWAVMHDATIAQDQSALGPVGVLR